MTKQSGQKPLRRLIKGVLLIINGIAIFGLLVAYLSFYTKPSAIPYIAFAGLSYPFILLVNAIFVVLWLFLRFRYLFFSLIAILLGWNHLGGLYQLKGSGDQENEGQKIRIVSYNIQNFIRINTSTTKYVKSFENRDSITRYLKAQKADIICLQEMLYDREDHNSFAGRMGRSLGCPNFYFVNYYKTSKNKIDAIATFTKYRIIHQEKITYLDKTMGILTDLLIESDTIRLFNLHLASIHFGQEDYDFLTDFSSQNDQEKIRAGTWQIISKMEIAFRKRGHQTEALSSLIQASPYPVIVCGDFNDTPFSYTYHILSKSLSDAFVESGSGFGITYAGENFPSFRIDYILYNDHFSSTGFQRDKIEFSDHYPINCYLIMKQKKPVVNLNITK